MQSVTDVFKDLIADRTGFKAVYRVKLRRRFFESTSPADFELEAEPIIFEADQILGISPIHLKLDTRQQNKILASNVTLRMRNERNKWVETNVTDGIFRPSLAVPGGFDPFRSEYVIEYGVIRPGSPDDDEELIAIFTGEATSYRFDTIKREAEISIRGREIKMQNADAQNVNTQLIDQPTTPPEGDGTNKDFLGEESIFDMQTVRVAAAEVDQGSRYKIEDENDAEKQVKITIDPAPDGGSPPDSVDYTARQWRRNETVSDLVGQLCDEADILPDVRNIEEPDYPDVSQFIQIKDKADFDLATLVKTDTKSRVGFLTLGDSIPGRKFETQADIDDNYDVGFGSTYTVGVTFLNSVKTSKTASIGGALKFRIVLTGPVTVSKDFSLIGAFTRFSFDTPSTPGTYTVSFQLVELPSTVHASITPKAVPAGLRDVKENMRVAVDIRSFFTITIPPNPPSFGMWIRNPRAIPIFTDGTWESDPRDLLATPSSFQKLILVETLNGGSILWETATAPAVGGPFDAFVAIDGVGNIQSTPRQFIKVRTTMAPDTPREDGPDVDSITINFQSGSLFIGHADFKQKTVFKAIARLAEITDMEYGFRGDGTFFFRNKPVVSASILDMDQSHFIQAVKTFNAGYDRVLNTAQVSYGPYYSEKNSITEGETPPTSVQRFGRKIRVLTINDFLFANNANFAAAIAEILYTNNFQAKRRIQLVSKIIPYIEIADVVTVSFFDSELIANTVFGDELQKEPSFGKNTNVIMREMPAKVVGISFDVMKHTSTLDLEEVLEL